MEIRLSLENDKFYDLAGSIQSCYFALLARVDNQGVVHNYTELVKELEFDIKAVETLCTNGFLEKIDDKNIKVVGV